MPNSTGRPPAMAIIARHGARLDASDKQWHLTSPTPYDPPLTYGGWTQSRALGARIASILHAREKPQTQNTAHINGAEASHDGVSGESESPKNDRMKRRKHRVVIHTSPFLRCVQTSIAISAGMAQYHGNHQPNHQTTKSPYLYSQLNHGGPPISPLLSAIPEPGIETSFRAAKQAKAHKPRKFRRPTLRVDAMLGEWLSPDYFEMITPPPSSVAMVVAAKAELLRPGDYSELVTEARASRGIHGFPGGWGSLTTGTGSVPEDGPLSSMSNLGQALQRNGRPSSVDDAHSDKSPPKHSPTQGNHTGYQPPPLTSAVSSSDPIPAGFVAHARDACVEVDYQWDSMREPRNWGDGGEYGEEWGAMHRRFRKGLGHLLSWYRDSDLPKSRSENTYKNGFGESLASQGVDDLEDDDTDIVVILVTHGAGCNALIGALTNQPVLLDVGMASMTMAVRKDIVNPPPSTEQIAPVPSSARVHSFSQEYDVKLVASTEHLRAHANPLVIPQLQTNSPTLSSYSPQFRNRYSTGGGSPVESSFSIDEPATRSTPPVGNGGTRRSATTATPRIPSRAFSSSPGPRTRTGSSLGGLWSPPITSSEATEEELSEGILLNFEDLGEGGKETEEEGDRGQAYGTAGRHKSRPGLWDGGPLMMPGERDRDRRRRWTMDEH
ncbi:hypothetical protein FGG08_004074 [Glutinoglossum americanum]|uniref:Phosphoglycerate mutase family protein n=1 Tax=Glutinoglossum americanum TaxID=1670608 RepID=A0A9P8HX41_9PEZI|nr:hypothetical protein FGG08_004074 [Glutinoglossum americanum]